MGNSPNKSTKQKQLPSQTGSEQKQIIAPINQKKEETKKDDLETEFLKFLADGQRKEKWKQYFNKSEIYSMEDLLSTYQMNTETKTGRRLNEAEIQILNNYLLKQSKEEAVTIIERGKKDLKVFQYLEENDNHNLEQIRNILVLGITGQGKSTFINSFVTAIERNFQPRIKGKEIELDYFKIVNVNNQTAASDTDKVSSYKFAYKNCLINIIDTPGLADTAGAQKDQERITQISSYIQENLERKNQKLHAVLFVSQSSTQYEIIDNNPTLIQLSMLSILKLFGKSMCEFTKHCLTFSDFTATLTQNFESPDSIFCSIKEEQYLIQQQKKEQQSNYQQTADQQQFNQIQQSQTKERIQENKKVSKEEFYFQFQNSVFQAKNQGFIENIHFKKNFDNYKGLLEFIIDQNNGGFNLDETREVIQERILIKNQLGSLQSNLQQCLKIYKTLDENDRKLKIYIAKKQDSSNFETVIYMTNWNKKTITKNGRQAYSTNCSECSKTCCKGCDSKYLDDCVMMIQQQVNNKQERLCTLCGHLTKSHNQDEFFWQATLEPKTIVDEYLKKENDEASNNITTIRQLVQVEEQKRLKSKAEIQSILIQMKNCLTKLLSSALYKLDILDIEAYDFVLKFYPEYEEYIKEFKDNLDLRVTQEIREKVKKDKLQLSQTLQSLATAQFQKKQFQRS